MNVAIIVFKRLDATQKMFAAVRAARPNKLFIIADGWRSEDERAKCLAVREYLESAIDWPCEVFKNYSETNLGCKARVVSGLTWVFENVEDTIILEDDCVPDPTFFPFCTELLERYRTNPRLMQIAAMNIQQDNPDFECAESYYFSQLGEIWGWATWRRAWVQYDVNMTKWPEAKKSGLLYEHFKDPAVADYFEYRFDQVYGAGNDRKKSDVWGAQWMLTLFLNNGLAIVPKTNLISNVGDADGATHTKPKKFEEKFARMKTEPLAFPLMHPTATPTNYQADAHTLKTGYNIKSTASEKILFFLKRKLPLLYTLLKSFT